MISDEKNKYELTEVYWHVLAARLAFVVVFQNVVGLAVMAIKMVVPNTSADLRERVRREAYLTNEIVIRTELLKARGKLDLRSEMSMAPNQVSPEKLATCSCEHKIFYRKPFVSSFFPPYLACSNSTYCVLSCI